jgi:hypothetical protein
MNPYVTFRDTDDNEVLQYYVLRREHPSYIGLLSSNPSANVPLVQVPIPGYTIWVIFAGTLQGNYVSVHPSYKDELEEIFTNMALWFLSNRIEKDPKRYKKWKIHASAYQQSNPED